MEKCLCQLCQGRKFRSKRVVREHICIHGQMDMLLSGSSRDREVQPTLDMHEGTDEIANDESPSECEQPMNDMEDENCSLTFGEVDNADCVDMADEVSIVEEDIETILVAEHDEMQESLGVAQDEGFVKWISLMLQWCRIRFNISDAGLAFILKLFGVILQATLSPLSTLFPSSVYLLNKRYPLEDDVEDMTNVVCTSCNAVYLPRDTFFERDGKKISSKCSYLKYGKPCNAILLQHKRLSMERSTLIPYKTFMFLRPSKWLVLLFNSKKFRSFLNAPIEHRNIAEKDLLEDIWDGQIWEKFIRDPTDGSVLLERKENLAFMLNVDWVKPFKRSQYKFGVMYLSILNLPRSQRLLRKWTLVVGIIPGPHEPKQHINTFLKPFVDDLLLLWAGIKVPVENEVIPCRAMLMCISSDIPALRKVTQFLGHRANKGCNKCVFEAEREVDQDERCTGRMSYFTKNGRFTGRDPNLVLEASREYQRAKSEVSAKAIATKNGLRFSELHRLPYFDIVNMCAEDPMHALLLGLIKKETCILLEQDTSSDNYRFAVPLNKREELRRRIKAIDVPSDCGNIPTSLAEKSTVEGFTAQQWLLFALVYARPAFAGLIPNDAFQCLTLLCKITDICAKHRLYRNEIDFLLELILKHHKLFGRLYGKWSVSINNHMMFHLPNSLANFGPSHVFWCFAFERMNGILTGVPSSGRSPEKEMFLKFLRQQRIAIDETQSFPPQNILQNAEVNSIANAIRQIREDEEIYEKISIGNQIQRLRAEAFLSCRNEDTDAFLRQCQVEAHESTHTFKPARMLGPSRIGKSMDDSFLFALQQHFDNVFESRSIYISPRMDKYSRCEVNGMTFSSAMNASDRSSYALAYWATNESQLPSKYFCKIQFFLQVRLTFTESDGTDRSICAPLAYVDWYRPSPSDKDAGLDKVCKALYRCNHIVSVYRLAQRIVTTEKGRQLLIIPLPL